MVAAHIHNLRAAASVGMKTVYVRRVGEDPIVKDGEMVKSKDEGGEVDCGGFIFGIVTSYFKRSIGLHDSK